MDVRNTDGFTLIEILVAIALSSIVITALLGVFLSFLEYQASSQDERDALESARFVLSDISRELSFGRDYRCGLTLNSRCVCLTFLDQLQRTTKIRHNSAAGRVEKSVQLLDHDPAVCAQVGDTSDVNTWAPLTDNSVNITGLSFELETQLNKQPRVRIFINADYDVDGTTEAFALKTQVTKRIFEPKSRALLESFRVGTDRVSGSDRAYFFYGPCDADITTKDKPDCPSGKSPGDLVCQDDQHNIQDDSLCERVGYKPIVSEFSKNGLFVLVDNMGFVFFIPNTKIDEVIRLKGGSSSPVQVKESGVLSSVVRSLGSGGIRGDDNDPRGVTSLYAGEDAVLARRYDGALYQLGARGGHASNAVRLFSGGISRDRSEQVGTEEDSALMSFVTSQGETRLQLHTNFTSLRGNIGPDTCKSEFTWMGTGSGCLRVHPEPSPDLNTGISINTTVSGALGSISLSFINRLQVVDGTIHIWYEDGGGKKLVSVGRSPNARQRTMTGHGSFNDLMIEGGPFVKAGSSGYTFICDGGHALCRVSDSGLFTENSSSISANDKISLRRDSNSDGDYDDRGEYDYGRVTKHIHFGRGQVGLSNKGRLLYFSGIGSPSASVKELAVRGLCGALSVGDSRQQVRFLHMSRKHPTKDVVALLGSVHYGDITIDGAQRFNEIFLLTTDMRSVNVPDICTTPASEKQFERHTFSGQSVSLDLIRLTALAPRDRATP